MSAYTDTEAALAAAAQAAEATAELIRYAREGAHSDRLCFSPEVDVVAKLADALKLAMEIEAPEQLAGFLDDEEMQLRETLQASIGAFLEGWAG